MKRIKALIVAMFISCLIIAIGFVIVRLRTPDCLIVRLTGDGCVCVNDKTFSLDRWMDRDKLASIADERKVVIENFGQAEFGDVWKFGAYCCLSIGGERIRSLELYISLGDDRTCRVNFFERRYDGAALSWRGTPINIISVDSGIDDLAVLDSDVAKVDLKLPSCLEVVCDVKTTRSDRVAMIIARFLDVCDNSCGVYLIPN